MPVGGVSLSLANYEVLSAGGFREVENVKIWILSHNFMAKVERATNSRRHMKEHDEHLYQIS